MDLNSPPSCTVVSHLPYFRAYSSPRLVASIMASPRSSNSFVSVLPPNSHFTVLAICSLLLKPTSRPLIRLHVQNDFKVEGAAPAFASTALEAFRSLQCYLSIPRLRLLPLLV